LGLLPSEPTHEEPERLSTPVALLTFRRPALPGNRCAVLPHRTMVRYGGFSVRITGSRPASPSGLCSLRRSETSSQRFRPRRARKLSWACSSSGVDRSAAHPAFHAKQLPWASRWHLPNIRRTEIRLAPCDGPCEVYDHGGWHGLSRDQPPLLRFPTLSCHSTARERARPELMVSLRAPSRVAALWQALFGSLRDRTSTGPKPQPKSCRGVGFRTTGNLPPGALPCPLQVRPES